MDLIIALTVVAVVTVIAEVSLWFLFRRRADPLSFPREFDTSYFRFFEKSRIRFMMLTHTAFVLIILGLLYIYLW